MKLKWKKLMLDMKQDMTQTFIYNKTWKTKDLYLLI